MTRFDKKPTVQSYMSERKLIIEVDINGDGVNRGEFNRYMVNPATV